MRVLLVAGFDAVATWAALFAAFFLRFDSIPPYWLATLHTAVPVYVVTRLVLGRISGVHRWSFRMSGLAEAARLVTTTAIGSAVCVAVLFYGVKLNLPRIVIALEFFLSATLMGMFRFGPRLGFRVYSERRRLANIGVRRTIIVGAGGTGELLARHLLRSTDDLFIVGFVDDDRSSVGSTVEGKPVLGVIDDMPRLLERHRVSLVLLAIPRLPAKRIRSILETCSRARASFKIVPSGFSGSTGRGSAAMLHDLQPEDLLPRDEVAFDRDEIRSLVAGRRVFVTGAGGSIGGEIARQVAEHGAEAVVLVDINENELYLLARRLREDHPSLRVHTEVADIRDAQRIQRLGRQYEPHYVFHAAAHKHVPLMEEAPEEAVKNNVFGTLHVAAMADACGAERFVLISTDKAVKPSSVMGVTKRVAELVVRDLARRSKTQMMAVRFGNVLGSAGSVVPIFKRQIERGGPVTVTHPQCTRYFMTIPEAVGLVLLAGLGGYGDLCVLDMGEPIKIAELARSLITMAGYVPDEEIPIVYTGLRPGEKLHEELLTEYEERTHVMRNRVMATESPAPPSDLHERLARLRLLAESADRAELRRELRVIVPTYRHTPNAPAPERVEAFGIRLVEGAAG